MNVLSLFDGMSCGRIALDRLGIPVDKYYASEIDKYAIQVSEANYPDIIRLGDVCDVKAEDLEPIDLLIAGSPCQGFSFAGKQLAFDDPRSALFFEFVRLLKECKPKYFLLENVRMKKEFLDIISEQVGCEPIFINSALVSAQNRQRFYWTNIPGIEQPEQRGIVLRDILETTPADPTLMSDSFVARQKKNINGKCLVDQNKEKAASLSAMEYVKNGRQGDYLACDDEGVPQDNPSEFDKNLDKMTNKDGKAYCVTARYTAAEPENSMQRKQRTMVPVMKDDLSELPEKSTVIKSNYYKSSRANFENDKSKGGKFSATGIPQTTHDTPKKINPSKKEYISKESVEKYVEDVNAEFNDPYNKKTIKGDKSTTLRTNSSNGNMWVNEKAIKETHDTQKPIKVGNIYPSGGQNGNIFSADGKSPTLSAGQGKTGRGIGSNNSPKIETHDTPKQVGTAVDINGHDVLKRVYSPDGKSPTVNTCQGGNREPKVVTGGAIRGRAFDKNGKRLGMNGESIAGKSTQMLELRKDAKSNAITTVGKDSLVVENEVYWRKLTPVECERLQTVPDNYTDCVSNTQRYKMLGNGWTIEVIAHIFKNMQLAEDGKDIPRATGQQTLDF